MRSRWLIACVLAGGLPCGRAAAQSVLVQVTAAESGAPLPGVFVSVTDAAGTVLRSALTDAAGRVLLTSPAPQFAVRAELIGRATQTSALLTLSPGQQQTIALALTEHAIRLSEIRVTPGARCRLRPAEALEIADVWDAARQALSIQAWSERSALYQLQISTYQRDLDSSGRRVLRESRRDVSRATRAPFVSLPAEQLLERGFIQEDEEGGHQYFAPDAALLLSREFLDTHCFRLTRSPDVPGALGLAFEPVRRDVAGIAGTLWLDEATKHLRHLEFSYTTSPYEEARGVAGGRVEFAAMPDGGWIIERWWIRAPVMARQANLARGGDSGIRVSGVHESGGMVIGATPRTALANARGSIGGIVWDSTRAQPLAGATVSLEGTEHSARSDGAGRFVLAGVAAGVYNAVLLHPRLDTLGIAPPAAEVEVTGGRAAQLALAVPSTTTLLLAACRDEGGSDGDGVLIGRVTDRARGTPVPGATVRVEWQRVSSIDPVVMAKAEWLEVQTDGEGRYTACAVPVRTAVHVQAKLLAYESEATRVELPRPDHRAVNFALDLPNNSGRALAPRRESGLQGVQGVLTERETGRHVSSADVVVRTVSGEVVARGLTGADGLFRLTLPTPGRYLLSANALGYRELAGQPVEVERGRLAVLDIRMTPQALALEPVIAAAESRSYQLELEGFYRRRSDTGGFFLDPETLSRRGPTRLTNLLFGVPGIRVVEPAGGGRGNAVRFTSTLDCWPMIYLDRHLVSTGGTVAAGAEPLAMDELVSAADIVAVEVYRSPAEVPSEFNGPNAGCGVIVLWTGRGGG